MHSALFFGSRNTCKLSVANDSDDVTAASMRGSRQSCRRAGWLPQVKSKRGRKAVLRRGVPVATACIATGLRLLRQRFGFPLTFSILLAFIAVITGGCGLVVAFAVAFTHVAFRMLFVIRQPEGLGMRQVCGLMARSGNPGRRCGPSACGRGSFGEVRSGTGN